MSEPEQLRLAEKVYNASEAAMEHADSPTPEENRECVSKDDLRDMTEYEMDVRDWGV